MKKQKIADWVQMYIAGAFHIILIILSIFPGHNSGVPLVAAFFGGIAYLIFWITAIILNKSIVPWRVYLIFFLGTALQLTLNVPGIIPPDGGFLSGLSQAIYCVLLMIETVIFGLVNPIAFVILRICSRRSHDNAVNTPDAPECRSVFDDYSMEQ